MKRMNNLYENICEFNNIENAFNEVCRNTKNKRKVENLKEYKSIYISRIYNILNNKNYVVGPYNTFKIYEPKERIIEKAPYRDRIVHRWYVDNFMKEYFIKSFINTSYACLENRGMHKACINVQNTMKHCKRIWNNYYIIKMDIAKYFQNIDKSILYNILQRKIKDKKLLWLTKEILLSIYG
mgnify:CR=1 FL=1